MQRPSVERTFRNLLYVYGRGRRRCTDPTIQADRFPLAGGKSAHVPCGRSTGKHNGIEIIIPYLQEFRFP